MTDAPPLFELVSARIDREGVPRIESLSVTAAGPRVALLGDWSALFELMQNEAKLVAGSVRLLGHSAEGVLGSGVAALSARDPELPKGWTVQRYLEESAALFGMRERDARDTARGVLAILGQTELETRKISSLRLHEQRAVSIARARLGEPLVLCLEAPLAGIDTELPYLVELIERAAVGRALVLSLDETDPEGEARALADRADDKLVLVAGALVGPTLATRFFVSVSDNAHSFADALSAQGHAIQVAQPNGSFGPVDPAELVRGGARRFIIETSSSDAILDASLATSAPILELRPLGKRAS
jgi:ABC-type Na+ transport system ATPase subunit NatA